MHQQVELTNTTKYKEHKDMITQENQTGKTFGKDLT